MNSGFVLVLVLVSRAIMLISMTMITIILRSMMMISMTMIIGLELILASFCVGLSDHGYE